MPITVAQKHEFLKQVQQRQDVLYGKHTPTITNEAKEAQWKEVWAWCEENAMPFVPTARAQTKAPPWKHVRDNVMAGYKNELKVGSCIELTPMWMQAKLDKLRTTGAGRDVNDVLNEAELCLREMLGADSAVLVGIRKDYDKVAFCLIWVYKHVFTQTPPVKRGKLTCASADSSAATSNNGDDNDASTSAPVMRKHKRPSTDDEMQQLKVALAKEQLEHALLMNHQCRLVNRQHEMRLNFPVFSHVFPHEVYEVENADQSGDSTMHS
ncbi:unnamed protein product [Sphagnum balticum]